jgi:hypothetical protein
MSKYASSGAVQFQTDPLSSLTSRIDSLPTPSPALPIHFVTYRRFFPFVIGSPFMPSNQQAKGESYGRAEVD